MIDSEKILDDVINKINIIDPSEIPAIDLYMDQVTTFMDKHLGNSKRFEDDKILTKTMINNYAKNNLLPSPEKKKYNTHHMIMLTFIYYLKNIITINDIKTLLGPISDRYFKEDSKVSLDDIYKQICESEKESLEGIKEDIQATIDLTKGIEIDGCNNKDKNFIQLFSLITLLSFDISIKKQIIESIVDTINKENNKDGAK